MRARFRRGDTCCKSLMPSSDISSPEGCNCWLVCDMGVDIAVDEAPHDRFAEARAVTPEHRAHLSRRAGTRKRASGDISLRVVSHARRARKLSARTRGCLADALSQSAREAASSAQTLDELRVRLDAFTGCALKTPRRSWFSRTAIRGRYHVRRRGAGRR